MIEDKLSMLEGTGSSMDDLLSRAAQAHSLRCVVSTQVRTISQRASRLYHEARELRDSVARADCHTLGFSSHEQASLVVDLDRIVKGLG